MMKKVQELQWSLKYGALFFMVFGFRRLVGKSSETSILRMECLVGIFVVFSSEKGLLEIFGDIKELMLWIWVRL